MYTVISDISKGVSITNVQTEDVKLAESTADKALLSLRKGKYIRILSTENWQTELFKVIVK